jgi:hypothetical protein
MKMPRIPVLWLLATWLVCASAQAHTDVPLKLTDDGNLVADPQDMKVPKKFLPLRYDKEEKLIRIGNRTMKLAPYFRSLFPDDGKYEVHFSTSWYHDLSLLPPYMLMRIEPDGRQFHYDLLLSLKDLSVIEFSVEVDLGGGSSRYFPVDLTHWKTEIEESVTVLKNKSEQDGADQPATASESDDPFSSNPKPESEARPQ